MRPDRAGLADRGPDRRQQSRQFGQGDVVGTVRCGIQATGADPRQAGGTAPTRGQTSLLKTQSWARAEHQHISPALMSHDPIRDTRCRPTRPGSQTISRTRSEVNTLNHSRLDATVLRWAAASIRTIRRATPLLVVTIMLALVGCSESNRPSTTTTATATVTTLPPAQPRLASDPRKWRLASDPAHLADDLVADEHALRDPSSSEAVLMAAARRQQAAYRALGQHPEWDPIAGPRIAPSLLEIYDRNVDARRQLTAMSKGKDTLPAWRIDPPTPADELLGYYREAESASGVGWTYLAAINLIETGFGRIAGVSTAGAQGPMQFLPSTFAAYGKGGDILSPHESIMAAGRYLAANGFADDRDYALYRYNNSNQYVQAVNDYAAVLAAIPLRLPATTGGTSTTTRLPVTCSCRSVTPRPHRSPSRTTWRPTQWRHRPFGSPARASGFSKLC